MATLLPKHASDYRVREVADLEFRSNDESTSGILVGSFGPLDEWVEINSRIEGHFLERFAPGCYEKTFLERAGRIRCLHRHGRDPLVGQNPIGKIAELYEDTEAARYKVDLFDGLPTFILDGYRAGQYGSSHTFRPIKTHFVSRPRRSEHNPEGLPEYTYTEVYVHEFGPCPFPIYENTTASMRSATDDWILERFAEDEPRGHGTAFFSGTTATSTGTATSDLKLIDREDPSDRLYARSVE